MASITIALNQCIRVEHFYTSRKTLLLLLRIQRNFDPHCLLFPSQSRSSLLQMMMMRAAAFAVKEGATHKSRPQHFYTFEPSP